MKSQSRESAVKKGSMRAASSLLLLFFLFPCFILAQAFTPSTGVRDSSLILKDSLFLPLTFESRDFALPADTVAVRQTKSAGKAVLLSALLPGLGQIYTRSYWKLPIIWGLGGYYIYGWIKNNNRYHDYRDQYLNSINPSNPQGNLEVKNIRDFYRNQRDSFAWYFGILYLANLVDAYVTASLYDFDVGDDLSLQVGQEGQLLTLRWRW
jgi:hypothetical protein